MLRPVFAKMKPWFIRSSDQLGKEGIVGLPLKKNGGQTTSGSIPILFQVSRGGRSRGMVDDSTLDESIEGDVRVSCDGDVEKIGQYQCQQCDVLDSKNHDEEEGWVRRKGVKEIAVKVKEIEVKGSEVSDGN